MKKSYIYLIVLFFSLYIFFFCYKEGYINIYETDELLKSEMSFIHDYICSEKYNVYDPRLPFQREPNYYYDLNETIRSGTYSSFLDIYGLKDQNDINKLCDSDKEIEYRYRFNKTDNQHRLIPGAFPEEDIQQIYKDEYIKDKNDFRKPLNLFTNPEKLENYIIYPEKIQHIILSKKIIPNSLNRPNK